MDSEMPQTIYVSTGDRKTRYGNWNDTPSKFAVKYIRADLVSQSAQADMTEDVFVEDAERKLYGRGFINTLSILLELADLYPNGLKIIKEKEKSE